jgi:hypothetical protein
MLLFVALTFQSAIGQHGGSVYSRYGVGNIFYIPSDRAFAMGGAGLSVFSDHSINRLNPASWTSINRTRFSAGGLYEGYAIDNGQQSAYFSIFQFDGALIAVPIDRQMGIVFGGGVMPYSRVRYDVTTTESQHDLTYTLQHTGSGGLSRAHAGLSIRIGSDLHLGAQFLYYFGSLDYFMRQAFNTGGLSNAEFTRSIRIHGIGGSVGMLFTGFKQMFGLRENQRLNIGLVYTPTSRLTSTEERFYTFRTGTVTSLDTSLSPDGIFRLPYSIGGGISFQSERILLSSDYFFQAWDRYSMTGDVITDARNSSRFSLGAEYIPSRDPGASFFERTSYRLGVFRQGSYVRLRGQAITENGLTGGVGFQVFGDTRLSIGAEYGNRGTTDFGLEKEKFLRLSVALNVGELWFARPPEE